MSAIRFGPTLRELRIHLCQTSQQSKGVRDFIQAHYVKIKKDNPNFPILIRECHGIQPRVWARYAKGCETCMKVSDLSAEQIYAVIKELAKKS